MPARVLSFLVALALSAAAYAEEPYRLAVIAPLSGEYASLGAFLRNGIQLALSRRAPADLARIEVLYEDDQLDPKRSLTAYRRLVDTQGARAVIVFGSAVAHALSPLAEKEGVLLIAIAASDPKIALGKQWSFIHWIAPEEEARVMVEEIKRRGYRRLGLLRQEQEGILAWNGHFQELLRSQDLARRVALEESHAMDVRDFKLFIAKAKAADVDGVCVTVFPGALSAFAKQARDLGLRAGIFGAESFEDWSEVRAAEGALQGAWYAYADDASESFQSAYRRSYGEPPGYGASNAFDVANILLDALALRGVGNLELRNALSGLKNYCGACGCYSATGDHRFTLPVILKRVTPAGFEKLRSESRGGGG